MSKLIYINRLVLIIIIAIFLSCDNKEILSDKKPNEKKQEQKLKPSKEEDFKNNFPTLDFISFDNNILIVKGSYDYTGDMDFDSHNINSNVWELANKYKDANLIKFNITFKGINHYGETKLYDLGYCIFKDLGEIRKYKGSEYFGADILSGGDILFGFLTSKKNSPYYIRILYN